MKILIVTDAWQPQINGVVRTYEYLSQELIALGHDVKVIGPHDFPWRMPMPGYREIELALFPYMRLSKMITAFAPDSVHIATEGPLGVAALKWCHRHKRRYSTAFHTMFPDYFAKRVARVGSWLYNPARNYGIRRIRRFHNNACFVMTTTPSVNQVLQSWGIHAPLVAIPRGVPLDLFTPNGPRAYGPMEKPTALFVGRVAIEKNIEAFLNMEWDGQKIVVGDGPSLASLKDEFPNVIFTGKKIGTELANWYRSADVFVFPSKTDTFGIVLIEALSCGLPAAGYPVPGPQDIITNLMLGAINEDLAQASRDALQAIGIKQQRHEFVAQNYTWPMIAKKFIESITAHNC